MCFKNFYDSYVTTDMTGLTFCDECSVIICDMLKNDPDDSSLRCIIRLKCTNNQITSLKYLPNSITYLECDNNQID